MKTLAGAVVGIVLVVCGGLIAALLAVAGGASSAASVSPLCATDANLATILATIRAVESGGDYRIESAGGSTASGAYQYLNSSWDGYGGYSRAADAPPEVQDQKAAESVRGILAANGGDVTAVSVTWYIGEVPAPGSSEWDTVPYPQNGNRLTPRQYQEKWLAEYERQLATAPPAAAGAGCAAAGPAAGTPFAGGPLPPSLDCASITWAGYRNGQIPQSAMRYRPHSTYLHPAASDSFDQLYAAAQAVGLDLRGNGYRPASAGGNTAGRSCHGLGLAVDVSALVGNGRTEFASPEFAWTCANAHSYGWIHPRWAIPEGMICGSTVGTGTGGNRGNRCCFLEAWHLESAGVVLTHPDFAS